MQTQGSNQFGRQITARIGNNLIGHREHSFFVFETIIADLGKKVTRKGFSATLPAVESEFYRCLRRIFPKKERLVLSKIAHPKRLKTQNCPQTMGAVRIIKKPYSA